MLRTIDELTEDSILKAEDFCATIDNANNQDDSVLLLSLIKILHVMSEVDLLSINPDAETESFVYNYRAFALDRLKDVFFFETFDPSDSKSLTVVSAMDCINDIYNALKRGLLILEQSRDRKHEVLWEWKNGYRYHWGRHVIDLLRFLILVRRDSGQHGE